MKSNGNFLEIYVTFSLLKPSIYREGDKQGRYEKEVRIKRMLYIFLALLMLLSAFPASATNQGSGISDEAVIYIDADTAFADCEDATIVVVPEGQLATIAGYAKSLVDSDKILYIADTSRNKEALAEYLSIPNSTTSVYNNMPHIAAVIYKAGNHYVFSYIYVQIDPGPYAADAESSTISSSAAEALSLDELVDMDDALASALDLYNAANQAPLLIAGARALPSGADATYSDVVKIYSSSGALLGDGLATQYLYKKGYGTVNGQQMYIFDVITSFKGAPNASTYLQTYQGRMHCNINGHTLIDYSVLPSNTSASSSIQLSGGGLSGGTSWTFTPDSQIITTTGVPSSKYVDYLGRPQVYRYGHTWEMLPGIRAASTNGDGSRGAFSKLTIPVYGILGTVREYNLEVGGWF